MSLHKSDGIEPHLNGLTMITQVGYKPPKGSSTENKPRSEIVKLGLVIDGVITI